MDNKIKLLIWTSSYSPVKGGLQTVVSQISNGIKNKNYNVSIITNRYPRYLKNEEKINNVKVFRYLHLSNIFSFKNNFKQFLFSIYSKIFFKKYFNKISNKILSLKPDVINVHFPTHQLQVLNKIIFNYRVKVILSFHGHEITKWFEERHGIVTDDLKKNNIQENKILDELRLAMQNCNSFTACSEWLMKKIHILIPDSRGKGYVVHNGVEFDRFSIGRSQISNDRIFSFGRLEYSKGFDLLIKAFKSIVSQYPNLSLIIAGSGSEYKYLEKLIENLGLIENVNIIEWQSPEMIAELLTSSKIIVIPSRRETFGISVLEGLCSMRPVVGTRIGGIPEVLQDYGLLVLPTVEGLTKGMVNALNFNVNEIDIKNHLKGFKLSEMIKKYEIIFKV